METSWQSLELILYPCLGKLFQSIRTSFSSRAHWSRLPRVCPTTVVFCKSIGSWYAGPCLLLRVHPHCYKLTEAVLSL